MEICIMSFWFWIRSLNTVTELDGAKQPFCHTRRRRRRSLSLRLELLEDRALPSAYVVTTTADSGPGSLRDAINQINADTSQTLYASPTNPGLDEIDFDITAASDTGGGYDASSGVCTITPSTVLPPITTPVFIDGYTQPGSVQNTLAGITVLGSAPNPLVQQGDNAVLNIVLPSQDAVGDTLLLTVAGDNSIVSGLVVQGRMNVTGSGSSVEGNFFGTGVTAIPQKPEPMKLQGFRVFLQF
jgi:hypothetical protein